MNPRATQRFDLDKAIGLWRRRYEYDRNFLPEDVRELEQHVRDHVQALAREGHSEKEAFLRVMQGVGEHEEVRAAYRQVLWGKLKRRHTLAGHVLSEISMFKNYLKTALRNLLRQKGFSAITIAGLTLGLTCCLIIFQYVAFEYSFDTFNKNAPDLYRVVTTRVQNEGTPDTQALTGWALGPALAEAVPEVVRYARLHPEYNNAVVSNPARPDRAFEEERVFYADPAFFEMFSYPLLEGEAGRVLSEPGTLLLSESAARKYFGDEEPMGQALDFRGWISGTFHVSGIFEDVPSHSHLQFDLLLPMRDLLELSQFSDPSSGWGWTNFLTYVQLQENAVPAVVERKFTDVLTRNREESLRQSNTRVHVGAQPLRDVHLNEAIFAPQTVMGSYRTVSFFILIGLITLLIALVNYVNLATARALNRAREVGVRKVVGAQQGQLVTQFLFESALTNLTAVALAVGLAAALRPVVNQLAGTALTDVIWTHPGFWMACLGVFCVATLLAGLYPAFVLSSFRPVAVLKGKAGAFASGARLRRGLVVLQFAASIGLLVGTTIVYAQLDYMRSMDLGIDLEQILLVPGPRVLPEGTGQTEAMETFIGELGRLPAVRETATSFTVPGQGFAFVSPIGRVAADPSEAAMVHATWIDTSFARFYGLDLLAGEGFTSRSTRTPEGEPTPILANETAVRALGIDSPEEAVGQELGDSNRFRLLGVVKDFYWSSAHQVRENIILLPGRGQRLASIKIGTEDLPQAIASIEEVYQRLFPGDPFRYAFVDEQFDQQYRNDQRFATLFGLFAGLAIAIACLGLFGLASFTAAQRTKEIGVRKVLGASVTGIAGLLSWDFLKLVGLAFLIAAPLAYLAMERWLDDFAYQIEIGPGVFVLTGAVVLVIALLTVSYQAVKAALANPVKSLRYE